MPDNDNRPDNTPDGDNNSQDASLGDLISSAIAARKNNRDEENRSAAADVKKTDEVFVKSESDTTDGGAEKSVVSEKKGNIADTDFDLRFDGGKENTSAVKKSKQGAADKKRPQAVAASASVAANGAAAPRKKSAQSAKPNQSAKSRQSGAKNSNSNSADKTNKNNVRQTEKKASPMDKQTGKPADTEGKKGSAPKDGEGWSKKKKIAVIAGAIFCTLCLLVLAVILIFHNYFSMLGGKWKDGSTDERPVYSDPDRESKAPTMTEEDAEKLLLDQLEQSATDLMKDSDVFNLLLVGEDLRTTSGEMRGNTDVMLLISINQKLKTITLTSFMRDIYVYLQEYDYSNKLNSAYWHAGPEYLEDVLERYFGVSIDRYAVVNFKQFITIVDTLGGLELDVTDEEVAAMEDPQNEQNMYLGQPFGTDLLKKGGTGLLLNGNQALAYSRIRKGVGDDYARTQRQREVISEMIKKAKKMSLLQLNDLLREVLPNIYTDMEEGETAAMLLHAFEYMKYDVQQLRIPDDGLFTEETLATNMGYLDCLVLNFEENAKVLQETIYGESLADDSSEDTDDTQAQNGGYYDEYGNWVAAE